MSVHKSKGLEFPVVFLCDMAQRFNKQDGRDMVIVHPELGLGLKFTDLKRRVKYPTLARNAIKQRLRASRFLSDREADAVDAEAIVKLFTSPLGRRMLCTKHMERVQVLAALPRRTALR